MSVHRHGGKCCGISHVYNLEYQYFGSEDKYIRWLKGECNKAYRNNRRRTLGYFNTYWGDYPEKRQHAIQVTITHRMTPWIERLKALGFKKVYSFHNGNSGNTVSIYMLTMNEVFK